MYICIVTEASLIIVFEAVAVLSLYSIIWTINWKEVAVFLINGGSHGLADLHRACLNLGLHKICYKKKGGTLKRLSLENL